MTGRSRIAVITFNERPSVNPTRKYNVLGEMALENRRRYCARHGYDFISEVAIPPDRPACWAKIPAMLRAMEDYPWVVWADSDALILAEEQRLEPFCDPAYDMIVQSLDEYFRVIGVPLAAGRARMPINSGVFLLRSSPWSAEFLARAYAETRFVTRGAVWDGVGEQEAMIAVLQRQPEDLARIKHVPGLQAGPAFHKPGNMFVHFYGNFAEHVIPAAESDAVLARWWAAVRGTAPWPSDLARFHWCCIQNAAPDSPVTRGDPAKFFYRRSDLTG